MSGVIAGSLNREVLRYWASIVLVLWFVLLSARFSLYLAQAVTGEIPASAVIQLAGLKSIGFAVFVMPLALFIALLLVLGRWNRDSESVALAASGFGLSGYLKALWPTLLLVTSLVFVLTLFVVPETTRQGYAFRHQASQSVDNKLWTAGRFVSLRNGELLLFADSFTEKNNTLNNVFVQSSSGGKQVLISAKHAVRHTNESNGESFIVLLQGYRYDGLPGTSDYRELKFDSYAVRLDSPATDTPFKWDAVATLALLRGSMPAAAAELQERLSRPISVIVLLIAGVVLGRFIPGKGRYAALFIGILVFIVYFNLLGTARTWLAKGEIPGILGLWWVHLAPLIIVWCVDKMQRYSSWKGRRT